MGNENKNGKQKKIDLEDIASEIRFAAKGI